MNNKLHIDNDDKYKIRKKLEKQLLKSHRYNEMIKFYAKYETEMKKRIIRKRQIGSFQVSVE